MNKTYQRVKSNLTGDVVSSLTNSVWSLIKGPVTLLLIPLFLSEVTQGYWYTFSSLAALATFADLGFTAIVGQFSAHEYAFLKINSGGVLEGDKTHLERLISLFRFVIKWAGSVSIIAFPIIMVVGAVVLNTHGNIMDWIVPWIIYIFCSGGNFIIGSVLSFFEGCNQIGRIQRNRLIGSMVTTLSTWVMLALHFSLYTLAFSSVLGVVTNVIMLSVRFRKLLAQMFKAKLTIACKWFKEFMSLLWRYAISWAGGYLIFQTFTPIAFMMYDPILAGKVGITMSLASACFSISNVWITVATPRINISISKGLWRNADKLMWKNAIFSLCTYLLGATCIIGGYLIFIDKLAILQRFLGIVPICILLFAYFLQIPVTATATYGRAHKMEPYMIPSVTTCLLGFGLTLLFAYTLPIDYLFLGFMITNLIGVFLFTFIYFKRKEIWHKRYEQKYIIPLQKEVIKNESEENV